MSATDLLLQWSIAVAVGALLYARGRLTLFHPATLYVCFHVFTFCIRPTLIATGWIADSGPLGALRSDLVNTRTALWVSSAGLVVFVISSWLASGAGAHLRAAAPREVDRCDRQAFLIVAALFGLGGCLATWWTARTPGSANWIQDLRYLALPLVVLSILLAGWRWWSLLPFAATAWLWTREAGAASYTWYGAALLICVLWLWTRGLFRPPAAMIALGLAALFAVVFIDPGVTWRPWQISNETPQAHDTSSPPLAEQLGRPELAHIEALVACITEWPATQAFTYGAQHRLMLDLTGSQLEQPELRVNAGRVPLPLSGLADGWMSGGWAGVCLTMGVVGLLLGFAFRLFARLQNERSAASAYAIVQAFSLPWICAGDSRVIRGALVAIVPLWIWSIAAAQLRKATLAAAQRDSLREERQRRRLLGTAMLNPNAAPLDGLANPTDGIERQTADPAMPPPSTELEAAYDPASAADSAEAGAPRSDQPGSARPIPRWRTPGAS